MEFECIYRPPYWPQYCHILLLSFMGSKTYFGWYISVFLTTGTLTNWPASSSFVLDTVSSPSRALLRSNSHQTFCTSSLLHFATCSSSPLFVSLLPLSLSGFPIMIFDVNIVDKVYSYHYFSLFVWGKKKFKEVHEGNKGILIYYKLLE